MVNCLFYKAFSYKSYLVIDIDLDAEKMLLSIAFTKRVIFSWDKKPMEALYGFCLAILRKDLN